MLTGTTPIYHQVHDNIGYQLGSPNVTLAELLSKHGYNTAAIISSFVLDSQFGIDQGFDYFNDQFEQEINTGRYSERRGDETTRLAVKWLNEAKKKQKPFFLFLHFYDPHWRYEPPQPFASNFRDNLYAGEVAYTDHCVGKVFDELKKLELYDSALIIVTSDHGEMLGEHGEQEHGFFIYESSIKVALLIKPPLRRKSSRVDKLVGLTDIFPTVCGLTNIQIPRHIQGEDLSVYFSESDKTLPERHFYSESITPAKQNANILMAVVTDKWKYIETTRSELYDLKKDPAEQNNLIEEKPQLVKLIRRQLQKMLDVYKSDKKMNSQIELDQESLQRLASLGYIEGSFQAELTSDKSKPDPKDVIKFHNIRAYNDMCLDLVKQGKLEEAIESLEKLIEHYEKTQIQHDMATIHYNLASALNKIDREKDANQHFDKAIELFQANLKTKINSPLLWSRLGNAFASKGDFKSATNAFQKVVKLQPDNMAGYVDLIYALEHTGELKRAEKVLNEAITYMQNLQRQKEVKWLKIHQGKIQTKIKQNLK